MTSDAAATPFAYVDPCSCYLVKHGEDYMVRDTDYQPGTNANAPTISLLEQLTQLKVRPDQVTFVGISPFHADHTGQLASLPNAMLPIGEREWAALTALKPMAGANVAGFTHWIGGGGKLEAQASDKDVFGDGSVMMHAGAHSGPPGAAGAPEGEGPGAPERRRGPLPRELPGQRRAGLQLRPHGNTGFAGAPKQIEKSLKATVIIQHDPRRRQAAGLPERGPVVRPRESVTPAQAGAQGRAQRVKAMPGFPPARE